jgi:RNA polymerase II subunit A small phosphatase-like protein
MEKPLLILDLDETLIFATPRKLEAEPDFGCFQYLVYRRPGLAGFIEECARHYRLGVWTSSTPGYAECIVSEIFGEIPLEFLWTRGRCTRRFDFESREPYWVKNLKKVKRAGYDLDRVLMVEDTPRNLERNYGNLVLVDEFTGDPSDRELIELGGYLRRLSREDDLRKIEKRGWRNWKQEEPDC